MIKLFLITITALLALASPVFAADPVPDPIVVYEGFGAFNSATLAKYPGFGCPLWDSASATDEDRVGFDSGICTVSYTAAQMAKVGVDPVEYGTTGLYECTWTTRITVVRSGYGNRTGSITTSGIFPADPTKSATFAIIGGTGDFEGAKGTMITEENPDCKYSKDPKSCVLKETFYFQ